VVAIEPLVEAMKKLDMLPGGRLCVPEADQPLGKCIDMLSDGTGSPKSSRCWILDTVLPHVFPLSGQNAVTEEDTRIMPTITSMQRRDSPGASHAEPPDAA
jgi:hypothetical protein